MNPKEDEFRRYARSLGLLTPGEINSLTNIAFPRKEVSEKVVRTMTREDARMLAMRLDKANMSKPIMSTVIWNYIENVASTNVDPKDIDLPKWL